jgi:hypothetical protein
MKAIKVFAIVVLIILVVPLLGYAGWLLKKGQPLEVFVVNKSMTDFRRSENRALNNILIREKIFTSANRTYDLTIDHYGLLWNKGDYRIKFPRLNELEYMAEKADMIYYADASGILTSQVRDIKKDEPDMVEYGGLNNSDYTLIRYFFEKGKPLVAECTFFSPPTESLVRFNIEKLTDIYYVGWIGKCVKDLADEADMRLGFDWKERYTEYTGNQWTAHGPGVVMINTEARRILVLSEGEDIKISEGFIYSSEAGIEKYSLPSRVNYDGWFTVLHEGRNNVLSNFQLNPTDIGKETLNEFGIPETFPALIHVEDHFYYLAGDFGKCRSGDFFHQVMVLGPVRNAIRSKSRGASSFYYSYYAPLMTKILNDALLIREGKNQN